MARKSDPPKATTGDAPVLGDLREAALEAAVQQLRAIHELRQRPSGPGSHARRSGTRATRPSDLLFDLARMSATQSEQWLRFGSKHADLVLDLLRSPAAPRREPGCAEGYVRLSMMGRAGKHATARLIVENPHSREADVSISLPTFRMEHGHDVFSMPVTLHRLDPPLEKGLKLDARESARFRVRLELGRPFKAGHRYLGEAFALVGGTVVGRIVIEVAVV